MAMVPGTVSSKTFVKHSVKQDYSGSDRHQNLKSWRILVNSLSECGTKDGAGGKFLWP
jgi:hypothetical protein